MTTPTKQEIKRQAISGLVDLVKSSDGDQLWQDIAEDMVPGAGIEDVADLAEALHSEALKQAEALAKPKAVGTLGLRNQRR